MRIGIISDTHGKLRPEVFKHFDGVEHILHAGDIGPAALLTELEAIAPVSAVFGNTDGFDIRQIVPERVEIELAGRTIVVVHGNQFGSPRPDVLGPAFPHADIVVFGHTHRPLEERIDATLFLNPGGAGAPRFGLRPSIMVLELGDAVSVRKIDL